MDCPYCAGETKVVDSRTPDVGQVRRRRLCKACGARFSTSEHVAVEHLQVRKRNGSIEPFDRSKLTRGIVKAASGQSLPPAEVDAFVDRIVDRIVPPALGAPVESMEIGNLVLQHLSDENDASDVARIRYAMVFLGSKQRAGGFTGAADVRGWLNENNIGAAVETPYIGTPLTVLKRDGTTDDFRLGKLERSIGIAAKGRGDDAQVHRYASKLARDEVDALRGQALVSSQQVAGEVLRQLILTENEVAYLRYASVTKRYQSHWHFRLEIEALLNRNLGGPDGVSSNAD
jgi:transcriptional repressor NrdR